MPANVRELIARHCKRQIIGSHRKNFTAAALVMWTFTRSLPQLLTDASFVPWTSDSMR
jgi:hypothetical protein